MAGWVCCMKQQRDTLPADWREGRRLRAWELAQQGWKQKDIAAALGVWLAPLSRPRNLKNK